MRPGTWAWVALGLLACGRTRSGELNGRGDDGAVGGEGGGEAASGPRLLPWQLEASGTEPLVLGAYDTELGQHCRFVPDAEGTLRCLPLVPDGLRATLNYADAACTDRVYSSAREMAGGARAARGRAVAVPPALDSCAGSYAVGVLEELPESAPRYFKTDAGCSRSASLPQDLQTDEVEFRLAEVTSPARFVSGVEADGELLAGRLRLREVETQQGFRSQRQLFDQRWQQACSLGESGQTLSCFPPMFEGYSSYFVDPECEGPQLWRAPECFEPAFIRTTDEWYGLGEVWTGPIFQAAKRCDEWTPDPATGDRFFTEGERLDESAVVRVAWVEAGDGRLRLRGLQGDDGEPIVLADELFDSSSQRRGTGERHFPRYHDAELGLDCSPVFTTDGEVRCVPETVMIDPYAFFHVDDQCSEVAYFCENPDSCLEAEMVAMAYDENGEYRAVSRNATAPVDGPLFAKQGERCLPQLSGSEGMFRKGPRLPWDGFPLLNEVNARPSGAP